MYAVSTLLWLSILQTEISLSTTEAEYIALIQVMREFIPIMELMKEVSFVFNIHLPNPEVFCKNIQRKSKLYCHCRIKKIITNNKTYRYQLS